MAEKLLAKTWNSNPSGMLWEHLWYVDSDENYTSMTFASGVFVPPTKYTDANDFWGKFEADKNKYQGWKIDTLGEQLTLP